MTDPDVERILREAFTAQADAAVGDARPVPPPRFATAPVRRRRGARVLAPLAAAAAVVAVIGSVLWVSDDQHGGRHPVVAAASSTPAAGSPSPVARHGAVHIRLFNADGAQYGVGMPVVAIFSRKITDGRALAQATRVTVNGRPTPAAWYFPAKPALGPMEAHLRPQRYWPADSKVEVSLATAGLSAGGPLRFDDSLTLDFSTGPAVVARVDDARHQMVVRTDGKRVGTYDVSLGTPRTPTQSGTKVILRQQPSICMTDGQSYHECGIKYAQQVTFDGEYLLAAPWNVGHIEKGIDSSNGCTNLRPEDAAFLYRTLRVGDVVQYVHVKGPAATMSTAFADWDVPWPTWVKGGAVPTS